MKHAYLVIAHDNQKVLDKIIKEFNNDNIKLFIHIDKKSTFNIKEFINAHKSNKVSFIKSKKCEWGAYSFLKTIIRLLKVSYKEKFDYYHLISGTTLPIKSIDYILNFYERNKGKEILYIFNPQEEHVYNLTHYRILAPRSKYRQNKLFKKIENIFLKIPIKRNLELESFKYKKSSCWFSFTYEFISYILSKNRWIKKTFRFTWNADEICFATLLYYSKFYKNIYKLEMQFQSRFIARVGPKTYMDWELNNSGPKFIDINNIDGINKSTCLYARKFSDESLDSIYPLIKK